MRCYIRMLCLHPINKQSMTTSLLNHSLQFASAAAAVDVAGQAAAPAVKRRRSAITSSTLRYLTAGPRAARHDSGGGAAASLPTLPALPAPSHGPIIHTICHLIVRTPFLRLNPCHRLFPFLNYQQGLSRRRCVTSIVHHHHHLKPLSTARRREES